MTGRLHSVYISLRPFESTRNLQSYYQDIENKQTSKEKQQMFNSRAYKINATINNLVQEFKIGFQSGYEAGRKRGENLRTAKFW